MATASVKAGQPVRRDKIIAWLQRVFALNPAGMNWPRGVMILDVILVPLVVFLAIGHEEYLVSAVFGVLFSAVADPGGSYRYRASHVAMFGAVGSGLTALAFGIGGDNWGWLVLAAFMVTLLASLAVMFGVHRFVGAVLLNVWFVIALALAVNFHKHAHVTSYTWAQLLSWLGGSALWVALTFVAWLLRGRADQPQPIAELPGDTSRRPLSRPLVMFALIRAIAVGGAVAIAFGTNLSHGLWLPIATIIAMKASIAESTIVAAQRLVGALLGAGVAILLLLIPANEHGLKLLGITHGLEVVALVFLMHGAASRFWNYAVYTGFIAAGVLILIDLPQPSNYSAEGYRVLWTLCGVGIGVLVMMFTWLLARRSASAQHQTS
jgi:hypothetical protein